MCCDWHFTGVQVNMNTKRNAICAMVQRTAMITAAL